MNQNNSLKRFQQYNTMDLKQIKLSKSEWESIEVDVTDKTVLNLIKNGYHDVNLKVNNSQSLFSFLKIEYSQKMEDTIYNKFLKTSVDRIESRLKKQCSTYVETKLDATAKPNSSDKIRLDRFNESVMQQHDIYENILLTLMTNLLEQLDNPMTLHYNYYTLYKLVRNNVFRVNRHIQTLVHHVLQFFEPSISKAFIIEHSVEIIEKNVHLIKHSDLVLYEHQKEIFTAVKKQVPKLILYIAPTGTGKTLTPIALSEEHRIIFVCAVRHVGLALAKSAISVNKKVAFAFGCSSANDIRLHYFAAKEYTLNKRSGGIYKVDNSVGDNVEIMICDIKSYLPAMLYMLAFFPATNIITYWDEPTITMDYTNHEMHETIHTNWKENLIPNVVLSSATLPKEHELTETIPDFLTKFPEAEICKIVSHDCKKSITILNHDGYVVLPHYITPHYGETMKIANHCANYLTLLRYFDLKEVAEFITFVNKHNYVSNKRLALERYFVSGLDAIHMTNIKLYYVELLQNIGEVNWSLVYAHFERTRMPRILENMRVDVKGKVRSMGPGSLIRSGNTGSNLSGAPLCRLASAPSIQDVTPLKPQGTSGVYVTTKDAYTLTDGPTIFISNDVEKVAKFCIQQANIPSAVMDDIMKKIDYNNVITKQIHELESQLDELKEHAEQKAKNLAKSGGDAKGKSGKDLRKMNREVPEEFGNRGSMHALAEKINSLRSLIRIASLNDVLIPNKKTHIEKWAADESITNAFTSSIDETVVANIMALNGIDTFWKVLLMMGIGGFIAHENLAYTEMMKKMADEQKLFMILANCDYIWGTNYQFCHGFISKDLNLTQEKIIQAMGRIGRGNVQQTYTVRFRDDAQILKLFTSDTEKPEVINMNRLFNSKRVIYRDGEYVEA